MFGKKKKTVTKQKYLIGISGETSAECERELTQKEYALIKDIFDDTESRYCGGYIVLIPSDDEVKEFGKDYHDFCKMAYYMTFSAYYHDKRKWPDCLYTRVRDLLVRERILTKNE